MCGALWACSQGNSARRPPPCLHCRQNKSFLSYAICLRCFFTIMRQDANAWAKHPKLLLTLFHALIHSLYSLHFLSLGLFPFLCSVFLPIHWPTSARSSNHNSDCMFYHIRASQPLSLSLFLFRQFLVIHDFLKFVNVRVSFWSHSGEVAGVFPAWHSAYCCLKKNWNTPESRRGVTAGIVPHGYRLLEHFYLI